MGAVGVIGIGTLGALAISILRLSSPGKVVAYGVREGELELARRLGATDTIRVPAEEAAVPELDVVVDTAGARRSWPLL
jgi:threonine dehydrogenase-like Zn-dependent dehydrogenase